MIRFTTNPFETYHLLYCDTEEEARSRVHPSSADVHVTRLSHRGLAELLGNVGPITSLADNNADCPVSLRTNRRSIMIHG